MGQPATPITDLAEVSRRTGVPLEVLQAKQVEAMRRMQSRPTTTAPAAPVAPATSPADGFEISPQAGPPGLQKRIWDATQ